MAEPIRFPDPPERLARGRWWQLMAFFGPGAIMASVTIGSGETVFASRAGAEFGYVALWCLLAGAVMKGIQVYGGMRFMVLTGHHPAESWGKLPGPRGWVPALLGAMSVFCFPFWICGLAMMLGTLCSWIIGLDVSDPERAALYAQRWATMFVAIGVTVTMLQTYKILENVELAIVGLLLFCIGIAAVVSGPDWGQVLMGSITPRIPEYEGWVVEKYPDVVARAPWLEMMAILGAAGGGTYDYVGYLGIIREKAWGLLKGKGAGLPDDRGEKVALPEASEEISKAGSWLKAPLIDCTVSFTAVALFSAAFLILGTTLLRPAQLIPNGVELLNHQVVFLTSIHGSLKYVYQLGIFFAFFGTVIAAYEINTRTTAECFWGIRPGFRRVSLKNIRLAVVAYCAIAGLILIWTIGSRPVTVVTLPAILGGVLACGLWCFAMVWADRRFLPKTYRMKSPMVIATLIAGAVMTVSGSIALFMFLEKHLGKLLGG